MKVIRWFFWDEVGYGIVYCYVDINLIRLLLGMFVDILIEY